MTSNPPPGPGAPAPVSPPATPGTPGTPATTQPPAEPPPEFHKAFAAVTGGAALLLAALLLWRPTLTAWDITKDDWLGDHGATAFAASVAVPLTVFGGLLVMIGAWMAAVEWRGRFKKEPAAKVQARGGVVDSLDEIITAVGKLRGAALVLVAGALLMLGAAWIGQSSADSPSTGTSTTATTPGG